MPLRAAIGAMRPHHALGNRRVFIPLRDLVQALAYLLFPRRTLLLGVVSLAAMHTLRIPAGNAAIDIPTSSWLLVAPMVLSLAPVRRSADLRIAHLKNARRRERSVDPTMIPAAIGA